MTIDELVDRRPVVVAIAGPNGAGKSTFFEAFLSRSGLRFVNADALARDLSLEPYGAAHVAGTIRRELLARKESFAFETVFSDPVGEKVGLLEEAAASGYAVILCFIGLSTVALSDERVAMRVTQGGHDVPPDKVSARYPRSLENLKRAVPRLPLVIVFDNSDLSKPFRRLATFRDGVVVERARTLPRWFRGLALF